MNFASAMTKSAARFWALSLVLLLAGGCESSSPESAGPVIAEIGDQAVTVDEFYRHLEQVNPLLNYQDLVATEQQRLLDDYVARRVYAAAARAEGLDRQNDVAARLEFFQQRVLAEAFQEQFSDTVQLPESEARNYYDNNMALYAVPAQYLIEHLVYKVPEKAIYAQGQLRDARPYVELAGHRETDADLTFAERNRFAADILLPELQEPVSQLEPGEVTELVYTNYGYHVIRLVEKQDETHRPFEEVRDEISARLKQAAAGRQLEAMVDEQLEEGRIKIHLEELRGAGEL